MLIQVGCDIRIHCSAATPLICLVTPHADRRADIVRETPLATLPNVPITTYRDGFGNDCRRLVAPAGDLRITYSALVFDSGLHDVYEPDAREIPPAELPDDCLVYLLGSRYCETDKLTQTAWNLFGSMPPGWQRVQSVVDYVHNRITFGYGFARATRTAAEAHEERVGVCRDFAHLAITLCRCLNIPARYVNGYLGDIGVPADPAPMDFSAWFEVYLGGRWYAFDARHNKPRIGRIVVARGRDATDVPLLHTFGQHWLNNFAVTAFEVVERQGNYGYENISPMKPQASQSQQLPPSQGGSQYAA